MTRTEHLLTTLSEECAEVAQRVSKALRFGIEEVQPGQPFNNSERVRQELWDLIGVYRMLVAEGVLPDLGVQLVTREAEEAVKAKQAKVEEYLRFSAARGRVDGVSADPSYPQPQADKPKPLCVTPFGEERDHHEVHAITGSCVKCGMRSHQISRQYQKVV